MDYKSTPKLAVFAYAFPHHRSNDFLHEIAAWASDQIIVLAAPWREIENRSSVNLGYERSYRRAPAILTSEVCKSLGLNYFEIEHDNESEIRGLLDKYSIKFGLISGARIIKKNIIDLFEMGVINIHPGKIPETSGLDSLYYTIEKGVALGVTTHFIDSRVDAGRFLDFVPTKIGIDDSLEMVHLNNTQSELIALRQVLLRLSEDKLDSTLICRPQKNAPMTNEQRIAAVSKFVDWRAKIFLEGIKRELFIACEQGDMLKTTEIIRKFPFLLEVRNTEGWTPLIVSSFNQRLHIVEFLLGEGANPNSAGLKGTTPLMYAKTKLLGCANEDYKILEILISNGARIDYVDSFGKSIFDYIEDEGDFRLSRWLRNKIYKPQ